MYSNDPHLMTVRKDAEFWCRKGAEHMHQGDYLTSLMFFDKALRIYPDLVTAWENKGKCLDDMDQYTQAITCYDQAIRIDPGNSEVWYNKSISHLKLGQQHETEACARTALDLAMGK